MSQDKLRAARNKAIAKQRKCPVRTVQRWRSQGAPMDDDAALEAWINERHRPTQAALDIQTDGKPLSKVTLARIARLEGQSKLDKLEEQKRKILLEELEGKLIARSVILDILSHWKASIESAFALIEGDAPNLVGLPKAKAQDRIRKALDRVRKEFHENPGKVLDDALLAGM